jgi:hypothetical protein
MFPTVLTFNFKASILVFFSLAFVLAGCLDDKEDVREHQSGKKLSCRHASDYIGIKASEFPSNLFSKVRMVRQGTPTTMDFVKNRTTIVYNENDYVENAYCG